MDSSLIRAIPFRKKVINFSCLFFIEIEFLIFQWIMAKKYRRMVARWHSTYLGCKQVRFAVEKQLLYVTERASFLYLNKHCSQTLFYWLCFYFCLILILFFHFFYYFSLFYYVFTIFYYFSLFFTIFHYFLTIFTIFTIFHFFHFFTIFHYFSLFSLFHYFSLFFTIFSLFPLFFQVALLKQ